MRAIVMHDFGGPDVLRLAEIAATAPGPGQVRVAVAAAAVNPVDIQTRRGIDREHIRAPFPMILGWDLAGTVEAVGDGVAAWGPGDRVVAMSAQAATGVGTYAEKVTLDAALLAPAPVSVELAVAAALPLAACAARQALGLLGLAPGDTLLVTGGVGAVGGFAAHQGLRVVAGVRPRDVDLARRLGADDVLDQDTPTDRLTPRVDGILHTAGDTGVIAALRDGGRFVSVTTLPPLRRGVTPRMSYVEQDGAALAELSALVDAGVLTLRVADIMPLQAAAEAHARLEAGGVRGKLLLSPLA